MIQIINTVAILKLFGLQKRIAAEQKALEEKRKKEEEERKRIAEERKKNLSEQKWLEEEERLRQEQEEEYRRLQEEEIRKRQEVRKFTRYDFLYLTQLSGGIKVILLGSDHIEICHAKCRTVCSLCLKWSFVQNTVGKNECPESKLV